MVEGAASGKFRGTSRMTLARTCERLHSLFRCQEALAKAEQLKQEGNTLFRSGQNEAALVS